MGLLFFIAVWLTVAAGWITNIVNVVNSPAVSEWTGFHIASAIGVFAAPLGVILGWVSWF